MLSVQVIALSHRVLNLTHTHAVCASSRPLPPHLCVLSTQVLAPCHISRGVLFGSTLALKDWHKIDGAYFDAPGALAAPLAVGVSDVSSSMGPALDPISMLFVSVEGAKAYVGLHRSDATAVHKELVALLKSVLRQVCTYGLRQVCIRLSSRPSATRL